MPREMTEIMLLAENDNIFFKIDDPSPKNEIQLSPTTSSILSHRG